MVLDLVRQVTSTPKIAFFDTGLLYRQTYQFVKNIQKWWQLDIAYITTTPAPLDVMIESGIWAHGTEKKTLNMRRLLIDNYLEKSQQHFESIYSIYGLRAEESEGRKYILHKHKGIVTRYKKSQIKDASMSPIWDWNTQEINDYILTNKLPLNTAYRKLRELGVPSNKRRTGVVINDGVHLGDWALNYQVDPSLGKVLETNLPLLKDFR